MTSPRIKICGLTRLEDAKKSVDLGAWALGFVLWPKSKRAATLQIVEEVIEGLAKSRSMPDKLVGVFVNPSVAEIEAAYNVGITTAQLHGDESSEFCNGLTGEVIKAFRLTSKAEAKQLEGFRVMANLIDAAVPGAYGGTGQKADWTVAKSLKTYGPLILSGGLDPDNIVAAVEEVDPWALDLASGVEESPGVKSAVKLDKLFHALR